MFECQIINIGEPIDVLWSQIRCYAYSYVQWYFLWHSKWSNLDKRTKHSLIHKLEEKFGGG